MIWLLSRLWVFGLVAFLAGFALTWFSVVQKRSVRARIAVDRVHAAHARSGSTSAVGSSLEELHEEDALSTRAAATRSVGEALEPRSSRRTDA